MKPRAILILSLFMSGCAGNAFLLQPKTHPSWTSALPLIGSKSQENSAIASAGSLAATYDRGDITYYEHAQLNGSVWVNYTVHIKNSATSSNTIQLKKIHLKATGFVAQSDSESDKIPIVLDSGTPETLKIKGNEYTGIECKFLIPKKVVKQFSNSKDPLSLVIPTVPTKSDQETAELQLPLWLWRVK